MTKQYHPEEVLVIEVESDCSNVSVAGRVLKRGTNRLEVLGRELALFEAKLETDLETFEAAKASWQQWCEGVRASAKTPEEAEQQIAKRQIKDHPYSRFRALANRDVKPLRAINVIESKGKRATPKNVNEDLMQAMRMLIERLASESTVSESKDSGKGKPGKGN